MTVNLVDKRRSGHKIPEVGLSNEAWFKILSIKGMGNLIDTRKTNDPLNVSPAKAKKMADLIEKNAFNFGLGQCQSMCVGIYVINFLRKCNGFRTYCGDVMDIRPKNVPFTMIVTAKGCEKSKAITVEDRVKAEFAARRTPMADKIAMFVAVTSMFYVLFSMIGL